MSIFNIPANNDYETFYQGHKIGDHSKKRVISMILTIVAGLLLYTGLREDPMDQQLTYAGALTIVYIFIGRNFMFKIKVQNLWKQRRETNPEIIADKKGIEVKHRIPEQCKTREWSDFGFYKIDGHRAFVYPKKSPENWLTLSFKDIPSTDSQEIKSLIKENIQISQENQSR